MLNGLHEIIITCHICQCIAVLLVIAVDQASVDCVDPLQAMSSEILDVLSTASAEQPADHSAQHGYDVESTMASVTTQNLSHSHEQLAVVQCLDREGWLVAPLVNGCRVAVLSTTCKQAVEGWPSRLKCLEVEPISGAGEVARKLQWVAHHCPKLQYLLFKISLDATVPPLQDFPKLQYILFKYPSYSTSSSAHHLDGISIDVEIPLSQKMESLFLIAWHRRNLALTRLRQDGWAVSDATYKLNDDDMRTLSQLRSPEPRILIVCAMGWGT